MHIYMHRLSLLCSEGRVGALEAQVRVGAKHAFRDGCGERVGDYVVEDVGRVDDGVLLDVACSGAEVVVRC